jgi:tetratricopeptide (TPR) repeat protein
MKEHLFVKLSGVVLACGVIAGCATQSNNVATTPEAFNKSLADADTVAKAGDQDKAMGLYQQLAKTDPTREEPWSRMAQIQFTQGHYGQAIVDAQEALQRDQTDRQAKSVLAVAGLRVATQSLGELRQDASLAGDAKTDAQALAKELRDTLGEATLFPPDDTDKPVVKKKYVRRVAKKPASADTASSSPAAAPTAAAPAPATPAAPAAPAAPARAAQSSGASDPFSALR